ncbi:MAG: hypothetical protein LH614_16540 [Pyrinomonadaceae bacterium]|nr:hypothetical protein [Pyrinomonadaceae bacterium]
MPNRIKNDAPSNAKVGWITIQKIVDKFKNTAEIQWQVEAFGDRSEKRTSTFDNQGNLKKAN